MGRARASARGRLAGDARMDLGVSAAVRRLGDAAAGEPDVRGVLAVWPLRWRVWWRFFPEDFDPYVDVEVAADTPGRASAKAQEAVSRALVRSGADPEARS